METLGAFLDAAAARAPEREAVAYAPSRRVTARQTWTELRAASRLAAKRLVALGAGKGTRLGLLCPNRLEWLAVAFGAFRIGAVLVPFSTLWKRDEIAYALVHGDVQTLVLVPQFLRHDYLGHLRAIGPALGRARDNAPLLDPAAPALRRAILLGGSAPDLESWEELPADVSDALLDALEAAVSPTDLATIFFTSGTTAQAKAVVHTHGALALSGRRVGECLGVGPEDAWWGHMPLFWSGGFVIGALATMAGGGRLVLQETVEAGAALELLETERCTIMAGWHQAGPLLEHPDFTRRRLALRKGSFHALADRLMGPDHLAVGMYGMSETATCVACARSDDPPAVRRETFGRPLPGMEVRIVDPETGEAAAPGEAGEIWVKGPTLMEGYYRVPRAETFTADGFFRTGDVGYLDEGGYLHFATRLKDVIKTAGVNVAAAEVEAALARHEAVAAAHVVGVPHPVRGENIAAFVVLRPNAQADEAGLIAFCREQLASYKVPKHVFVVSEAAVPRTGTGKVAKPALRREAEARLKE
ncbi:MAG TPA: class I adenylate-forming enzyme family protein [Candidatus Limnocylindria bacterium]|nr:class I adenylate-forming enzyme family protein [Candidatus Limnocylindria bacterium]